MIMRVKMRRVSFGLYRLTILCAILGLGGCVGEKRGSSWDREAPVGGPFENREFTYLGIPKVLCSTDTSPAWNQPGERILVTGTVLNSDALTPAPNVLIYYYHTDREGRYATNPSDPRNLPPNALGQTHGHIRGWVQTDSEGRFSIYTVRPGPYPTLEEPAHIHVTIKEPNELNEYYIDDFVFDDDPILTADRRRNMEHRGGSGVLRLVRKDDLWVGERDIILGLNIPGHPGGGSVR